MYQKLRFEPNFVLNRVDGQDGPCIFSRVVMLVLHRGNSLIRNTPLLEPYSRAILRVIWWSWGGGLFLMSEVPFNQQTLWQGGRMRVMGRCAAPRRASMTRCVGRTSLPLSPSLAPRARNLLSLASLSPCVGGGALSLLFVLCKECVSNIVWIFVY